MEFNERTLDKFREDFKSAVSELEQQYVIASFGLLGNEIEEL